MVPIRFQITALLAVLHAVASIAPAAARTQAPTAGRTSLEADGSAGTPRPGDAQTFAALTLDQAVALAERTYMARVVRADTQHDGERVVYVLRLLNSAGRVWTVRVDAQTGQMQ